MISYIFRIVALVLMFAATAQAQTLAQTLAGPALLGALQKGGNVIVMRHASSPVATPTSANAAPGNVGLERQLDETGRSTATAMGNAIRNLKIPVSMVLSSTAYRALQTALYLKVAEPKAYSELNDGGMNTQRINPALGTWIRELVQRSPAGGNMLIITHSSNIVAAFPQLGGDMADGEALVMRKDSKGGAVLLARIRIEAWPKLGR